MAEPVWTGEMDARLTRLRAIGRTYSEIARDIGVTRLAAKSRHRRLHNRRPEMSAERLVELHAKYEAGQSLETVSVLARVSPNTLRRRFQAAGLRVRTKEEISKRLSLMRAQRERDAWAEQAAARAASPWPPTDRDALRAFLSMSGKLYADDPRAARDYGTPGRVARPGPAISITGSTADWCAAG